MKIKSKVLTLWEKTSKNGKVYYIGYVDLGINGQIKVVAFSNENKEAGDNRPALFGYLSEDQKTNDYHSANGANYNGTTALNSSSGHTLSPPISDDDIPF